MGGRRARTRRTRPFGNNRGRAHAGGRLPREVRLGLRRRQFIRADAPLRLSRRLRRFVDRAHAAGLGVILDVVYNHLGPDGNYLREFAQDYFTDRYTTDWGDAINFDGENAEPVREYFIANAGYWIDEFHLDGLRLDATQNIYDLSGRSHPGRRRAAPASARGRSIIIVAENEPQETVLIRPQEQGGYGMDALWNDDFHHSAMVAMTGRNEAYYTDYLGKPQEFISAVKYGYLYQGQWYNWQEWRRGTPSLKIPPRAFVTFIQNHDQVANSGRGERCHQLTSPGLYRAMTALTLLAPSTPMLFQGQEFAASSPFLFFADHNEGLAPLVRRGRAEFLAQFRSLSTPEVQAVLDDPGDERTFERSKLDLSERERHSAIYEMHRDLLRLRREDAVFGGAASGVDGAVLGDEAFVLRFFGERKRRPAAACQSRTRSESQPRARTVAGPPRGEGMASSMVERRPALWRDGSAAARRGREMVS